MSRIRALVLVIAATMGLLPLSTLPAHADAIVGSNGAIYQATYPDQETPSTFTPITTATTTLVVAGVTGQNIYLFFAGNMSTGTNSSAFTYFAYGPNSSTLTPLFLGQFVSINTTTGSVNASYGNLNGFAQVVAPAAFPRVIPAGQNLYIVTTGTTINCRPYVLYAQHA